MGHQNTLLLITTMVGTSLCTVFNVVPSPDNYRKCEDNHCITLTQFATNSSLYLDTTNTTLLLEPGNHTLDINLEIRNISWFAVVSLSSETDIPVIACSHSAKTYFTNISQVHIHGIKFIGCRRNQYVFVNRLMVKNSTFFNPPGQNSASALQLILTTAIVIHCSFVNLTGTSHKIWTFVVPVNISLGGAIISMQSNITIIRSTFQGNRATEGGALFALKQSNITVFETIFANNQAVCPNEMCMNESFQFAPQGGVLAIYESNLLIKSSIFDSNYACSSGGAIHAINSTIKVSATTCINNTAAANSENNCTTHGGVLSSNQSTINFTDCNLNFNRADYGGVMATVRSIVVIKNDTFTGNSAKCGGGIIISYQDHVHAVGNHFVNNNSGERGGSVTAAWSSIIAVTNSFINSTSYIAGVIFAGECNVSFSQNTFSHNFATVGSILFAVACNITMREDTSVFNMGKESIMSVHSSDITIYGTFIAYNRALDGPALFMSLVTFDSYGMVNIRNNNADQGVLYFELCQIYLSGRTMFNNNTGSISIINSDVFFNGVTYIYNCSITINTSLSSVLSIQLSTVVFNGTSIIANNKAVRGGAISMIDSTAFLYGNITIGNNAALLNAGGLYLYKSQFHSEKGSHLIVYGNKAGTDGGGISAQSSTILVMNDFKQAPVVQNSRINVVKNRAKIGGGMSLWNSNLHIDSSAPISLYLADNTATHYGGAIYVDDYSNEYMCNSNKTEFFSSLSLCFLQMISDTYIREMYNSIGHMYTYLYFSQNYAMMAGSTIFGGLLNRCLIQNGSHPSHLTGFSFLKLVSNIGSLTSVSSHPVGVCFCKGHQPNCSYKHPTIYVMKGYLFMLSVVAVDQVNNTVKFSTIASFLSFGGGGLGIDQHAQKTEQACTELKFNVFSIDASTELNLLAQGPCRDALPSTKKVKIVFIPCSCPIGFQPTHADETKCKCGCDPELPYKINTCDPHNTTVDFKFNCC